MGEKKVKLWEMEQNVGCQGLWSVSSRRVQTSSFKTNKFGDLITTWWLELIGLYHVLECAKREEILKIPTTKKKR